MRLPEDAVQVWIGRTDDPRIDALAPALSDEERGRAARFVKAHDARAYVAARSVARALVGRAMDRAPASLAFAVTAHGKPYVARAPGDRDVRFNVSHSGELAAVAVAFGREVGIDVEAHRDLPDLDDVAATAFSSRERADLAARAGEAKRRAFFACWSRKEAVLKAIGLGLAYPPRDFDVTIDPDAAPALIAARDPRLDPSRWSLHPLAAPAGYSAALAIERVDDPPLHNARSIEAVTL